MTQHVPFPPSVFILSKECATEGAGRQRTLHSRFCFFFSLPFLKQNSEQVSVGGQTGRRALMHTASVSPRRTPTPGLPAVRPTVLTAPAVPPTMATRRRRESAGKPEVEMGQPDGKRGHTGQGQEAPALTSSLGAAVPRGRGRERAGRGGALDARTGRAVGRQPITVACVSAWAGRRCCLGDALRRPCSAR